MNSPVMIPDKPDTPDPKFVALMSNEWPETLACFDIGGQESIDVSLLVFKLIPEGCFGLTSMVKFTEKAPRKINYVIRVTIVVPIYFKAEIRCSEVHRKWTSHMVADFATWFVAEGAACRYLRCTF